MHTLSVSGPPGDAVVSLGWAVGLPVGRRDRRTQDTKSGRARADTIPADSVHVLPLQSSVRDEIPSTKQSLKYFLFECLKQFVCLFDTVFAYVAAESVC